MERSRVLQDALHVIATEHHELEQSISAGRKSPAKFYDTDDDEFYDCDDDGRYFFWFGGLIMSHICTSGLRGSSTQAICSYIDPIFGFL
jgi:hypothetical protein